MVAPVSTHLPEFAGELILMTGETVVASGLREIQSASATLALSDFTANEESKVSIRIDSSDQTKLIIRVEKGGSNEGTLGDNEVPVFWMALGK
jgi:hypothetical protein